MHARIQRVGDRGSGPPSPLKNHKNIGCLSNIGPDPLAFCWRADEGPLIVVFGSSLPSSNNKKNVVEVGPPLTKLPVSAHVLGIFPFQESANTVINELYCFINYSIE